MSLDVRETSKRIVEKASKAEFDESIALAASSKRVMVKIANSEPSIIQTWRDLSVSIYLAKGRRIMILNLEPSTLETVFKAVEESSKLADRVAESHIYAPIPEPMEVKPIEGLEDLRVAEAMENPADLAELMIEAAHREKVDRVAGALSLAVCEKGLATSKGAELYERSSRVEAYLRAFSGEGSGQWAYGSTKLDKDALEDTALRASRYAVDSRSPEPIEPGIYDLVLSPMTAGGLLADICSMASAFSVITSSSIFVRHKPGSKVGSEAITLIDDPLDPTMIGSTSFDDEGVPTRSKFIIEKGVVKSLLHNSKTAQMFKTKTTGNAGWIRPHAWNLKVSPGELDEEELIAEVKRGLLVTNNWYTRLQNPVEGSFSTITRDALFLIEDGEIAKPVRKLRISDAFPRLLSNTEALGKRGYYVRWWEVRLPTLTPFMLIRKIHTTKHLL